MMKIALIQFSPQLGNPEGTLARISTLLGMVREADLILFPELANSGYHFESREQACQLSEEVNHSRFVDFMTAACRDRDCFIVTGFNEREGDRLYNSSLLIGPGGLIGIYRKIHLFWDEKDIFSRGNKGLPVFDIGHCRIGMLVCFDWIFPEVWRILALKGADLISHPANLVLPYAQRVIPAYSIINRIYIALVNRTGREGSLLFTGKSLVSDPRGEILVMADESEEQLLLAEIDPLTARDKQVTPRNDAFGDRFPEEYGELLG